MIFVNGLVCRFSQVMPQQFNDFAANIPLPSRILSDGALNVIAHLPVGHCNVPDLSVSMFCAYGTAHLESGTTHLHLDVADAANKVVYVGKETHPSETRGKI